MEMFVVVVISRTVCRRMEPFAAHNSPIKNISSKRDPTPHSTNNNQSLRRDHDSPTVRAVAGYRDFERIRAARAVTGGAGIVRSALLRGHPTHQRNRRAHGV